jgi:DNA-binding transcriptional ArsR family regulator
MVDRPISLIFETGTGYDFLASLYVLHAPDRFGLRPSWAAGVRSRLSNSERRFLEEIHGVISLPAPWVHSLPAPRSAAIVLWELARLPAEERLAALSLTAETPDAVRQMLTNIARCGSWNNADLELAQKLFPVGLSGRPRPWRKTLDWWARSEEFGQAYLAALQAFYGAFFVEEEQRILPVLAAAVHRAQELSARVGLEELIDNLTGGLHFSRLSDAQELVLAPSYWLTPLAFFGALSPQRMLLVFGGRPLDATLVPGEVVPDALLITLKALADPTRLQILRLLSHSPLTLTQLARRLRLRLPTITHHLSNLRLAGLVQVNLGSGDEKRYAVRQAALQTSFTTLNTYLQQPFLESIDE